MALPSNYNIKQYLPTEQDFADVFAAKQNGHTEALKWYPYAVEEPYYYQTIRIYLAAILLKWEELGKQIENTLIEGRSEWINGNKQLIPYYTAKDLATIRSFAVQYKHYYLSSYMKYRDAGQGVESPEKRRQMARDARKGEIDVKIKGTGNLLRIIPYSMKYGDADPNKKQAGARMHLFFGKENGGKYNLAIRGSTISGSDNNPILDTPYFVTEQEARDFIANIDHNHINTKVTIEDWRFVITDQRIEDGMTRDANGNYIKNYYNPKLSDARKVDTACGPAYMLNERDKYWDKIYKDRAARKAKAKGI